MYEVHKYVVCPSLMVFTPEKNSAMEGGATVVGVDGVVVVVELLAGITVTVTVAVLV